MDPQLDNLIATVESKPEVFSLLVLRHRLRLSNHVVACCQGKVARGPFTGMVLPAATGGWGDADRGAMALGLYEQEVLDLITQYSTPGCTFINLGAADGYYGIGMLRSGIASSAYCFEMDDTARAKLIQHARTNGVADRLKVFGKADARFFERLDPLQAGRAFILCDIEGAEFDVFPSADAFLRFKDSHIVIEIHDWSDELKQRTQKLVADASQTHRPTFFRTSSRDLSGIDLLKDLDDTTRWLVCSEGRPKLMEWCHLKPCSQV